MINRPHGIILVTGPTGSGKSTTLYAALNEINTIEKKILTIEEPIEYRINGVMQVQVNPSDPPDVRPAACAPSCARTPT